MRFHLDEHIHPAVAAALRRRGIDVTTTNEAGLCGAADTAHINFARDPDRVIVTSDADFLALARAGIHHCGIVWCSPSRTVGEIIEFLLLMEACLRKEEMIDHLEFC
jgi:predicted nuclease of predicted toxin-antitoxin system